MAFKMLLVVCKVLLICTLLLAFQAAARELLQTSDSLVPQMSPIEKLRRRDVPWGHNP
ncbi:hypothetical protein RHGRI_003839 [Rhododendron griersonianum]|uniref:Uncharacterized protein n=1 Tax=Rhododendron griersonianum TaxID=479676 RepID=A0AAV6L8D3_9ERIC|nr:hypothetical protein RHGRI_003839 [Rhododendron griersonianum]